MVRINWTFQAKSDLKAIAEYISKDSKRYAKLQVSRLKNRTRILKTQIRAGKIVPEINKENIRELIEGNYRIIYKIVVDNQIDILTVHHSARDLTRRKI
ncbi:MAG: type II toxin-antitoxin system RelE/ParE family toxin [Melioribacteraceae bacterium]|nr:type II toxin-antitoxin system RelE/ParE family toxin [Melioribacteraceae bacterium]